MPDAHDADPYDILVTCVPARNTFCLALAWAEVIEARDIFIGLMPWIIRVIGLPPEYIAARTMANWPLPV